MPALDTIKALEAERANLWQNDCLTRAQRIRLTEIAQELEVAWGLRRREFAGVSLESKPGPVNEEPYHRDNRRGPRLGRCKPDDFEYPNCPNCRDNEFVVCNGKTTTSIPRYYCKSCRMGFQKNSEAA